jgi:hypothetical protein
VREIADQAAVGKVAQAGSRGPGGVMAGADRRQACARSIPGSAGLPIAVQQVLFEGTPAFVFVYDDAAVGRRVVVVAADCGQVPGSTATVLYRLPG